MIKPRIYRRKVDRVMAIRFTGDNGADVRAWLGNVVRAELRVPARVVISNASGEQTAEAGDWIAQNPTNPTDFYVIPDAEFERLYDGHPIG